MVINSVVFLFFFIIVFAVYYLPSVSRSARTQNLWILITSYFFYGCVDIRMLFLLILLSIVFYVLGIKIKSMMENCEWRNASVLTSLGTCLGIVVLLYFKYLNFFAEGAADLLSAIGFQVSWTVLNIIIPVGVSFYTFKLMSYIIEIHRERIEPSKDIIEFGAYIAFFPTIMSGPIDRPNKFIHQLRSNREFNYGLSVDGCRQILWGMFTKMCVADNMAQLTDRCWANLDTEDGSLLMIVALLYPIQIYADFDGYSNMAIGVGKLLGINVCRNFNHPLLSRDMAEYWQKWHISLTSWLTDYVFLPLNLAFRRLKKLGVIVAVIINFMLVGLWHGANWTYGLFGLYHGLLFIPLVLSGSFGKQRNIVYGQYRLPVLSDVVKMLMTFLLVAIGLVIFRAPTLSMIYVYFTKLISLSTFDIYQIIEHFKSMELLKGVVFGCILLLAEWYCRNKQHNMEIKSGDFLYNKNNIRRALYISLLLVVLIFKGEASEFIYFKF